VETVKRWPSIQKGKVRVSLMCTYIDNIDIYDALYVFVVLKLYLDSLFINLPSIWMGLLQR
jgi:hypothetical protein